MLFNNNFGVEGLYVCSKYSLISMYFFCLILFLPGNLVQVAYSNIIGLEDTQYTCVFIAYFYCYEDFDICWTEIII